MYFNLLYYIQQKKTNPTTKKKEKCKMKKNTIKAIEKRINHGEDQFFIGAYFYQVNINGMIRRREQEAGRTPVSDWEVVARWDAETKNYKFF